MNGINPVFESVNVKDPDISRLNDTDGKQILALNLLCVRIRKRSVSFEEEDDSVQLFFSSPDCSRMKSFTEGNIMNVFFFSGCCFMACCFLGFLELIYPRTYKNQVIFHLFSDRKSVV